MAVKWRSGAVSGLLVYVRFKRHQSIAELKNIHGVSM